MNPPPYTPLFTDSQAVADEMNQRVGVMLAQDSPPATMPATSVYEVAEADGALLTRGIQLRDLLGLNSISGTSTMGADIAYVDSPFGSVEFTPRVSRTYYLETRLSMYVSGFVGPVKFRLILNSAHIDDDEATYLFNALNDHRRIDFMIPAFLTAGTLYTISWQWIGSSHQTLAANSDDIRVLRVWT